MFLLYLQRVNMFYVCKGKQFAYNTQAKCRLFICKTLIFNIV